MDKDVQLVEPSGEVDTLDFLNDSLDNEDNLPAKVEEPKETEAEEELELSEEAEPEIKEDEIDFASPFKRSELLKAYPDIFKKFPDLPTKIYRGEKYEEVFPTIKDANEAKERVETLERAEAALYSGDISDILKSVKDNDQEAFNRVVDNFLPSIEKIDRAAYLHTVGNIGKFFIENIIKEAGRYDKDSDGHKNLLLAGTALHQYLFGTTQWTPPTKLAKETSENDKRINEREQAMVAQRFDEVKNDLIERADNTITATINKYIDPKDSMTPYIRSKAIDDCKKLIDKAILADETYRAKLDRLWSNVITSNFSRASQEQVKDAYLGKVKSMLLDVIKKVRNDALAGAATKARKKVDEEERPAKPSSGNSAPAKRGQNEDGPRRGESTKDYLNRTLGV